MPQTITVDQLLADDTLLGQFLAWQPSLTPAVMWCKEALSGYINDDTSMEELAQQFGPGGEYPIDWDALGIAHMIDFGVRYDADGASEDEDLLGGSHATGLVTRVIRDIDAEFRQLLQSYADSFAFSLETSDPQAQVIDLTDIDWATVESFNEAILKNLGPGESVAFWQTGSQLILGDTQSAAWRMAIERANGYDPPTGDEQSGWVTMAARGSTFSSGKISVSGNYEKTGFKTALRRFSNKDVDFV